MTETPATIIIALGGPTVVAKWLTGYLKPQTDIDFKTVSNWKVRGIPLRYWKPLLAMSKELYVQGLLPIEFIDAHTRPTPRLRKRATTR